MLLSRQPQIGRHPLSQVAGFIFGTQTPILIAKTELYDKEVMMFRSHIDEVGQ
jgi:hypothetical protein